MRSDFYPPFPQNMRVFSAEFLNSHFFQFFVLISVMWWSNHSTDGGGYLALRTMAAKDERHAPAANLWYNFANFALRTWPWVIVAFGFDGDVRRSIRPRAGRKGWLPAGHAGSFGSGMRGLLLVSFLAAFMSTIDTHLNWASSYLVHDIYRRFLQPGRGEGHYVLVGRIITVALMVIAAVSGHANGQHRKGLEVRDGDGRWNWPGSDPALVLVAN